jgi:hypothetical protein
MSLKLLNPTEYVKEIQFVHCAVKGPHGSGKTTIAGSATKVWFPALIIDAEGGQLSVAHLLTKDVTIAAVRPIDSKNHKEFFSNLGEALAEAFNEKYKLIIVDSIGEIVSRMIDEYATVSKSGMPGQNDWFKTMSRARDFCRLIRDLRKHTIVTFLTEKIKDDKTIYDVALPGQLSTELPSMYDVLALMLKKIGSKGETQHWFCTDGQGVYQVRSRLHGLNPEEHVVSEKPWTVWEKVNGLHQSLMNGK